MVRLSEHCWHTAHAVLVTCGARSSYALEVVAGAGGDVAAVDFLARDRAQSTANVSRISDSELSTLSSSGSAWGNKARPRVMMLICAPGRQAEQMATRAWRFRDRDGLALSSIITRPLRAPAMTRSSDSVTSSCDELLLRVR
jgi:hypothetical protein